MSFVDSGYYTPETLQRRAKIAEALLSQSMQPQTIEHPMQGVAQMTRALMGAYGLHRLEKQERAGEESKASALAKLLGGGGGMTGGAGTGPATPASPWAGVPLPGQEGAPTGGGDRGAAIASIESGGRYDILGPVTKSGDRAYGKYQVMGSNIGPWTEEILGRRMTPQEFLANPQAQDAVFKGKFGQYERQYGNPQDAASAWFTGRPLAEGANRRDQLGTTGQSYVDKFTRALAAPGGAPAMPPGMPGTPPPMQSGVLPPIPQGTQDIPGVGPMGAASMPGMPSPGPVPAPTAAPQAPVGNPAVAQIAALLQSKNPYERRMGMQLAQGAISKQFTQQPKWEKLDEGTLFEQASGRTMPVGGNRRSLIDPAERAKYGIPAEDKRPYQVGPNNRLINPPAETRLTVDQRGESKFTQEAAGLQAKRFNSLVEKGHEAQSLVADLNVLRDIGSRITTGKRAEVQAALGPYAEALGLKIEGLSDLQAYNAIIARIQPRMRVPGSGATSDYEMQQFLRALPGLGNTPEGNALVTQTLEMMQQHHIAASDIGSRALAGEISPKEAEKELRALPDPFTLWKKNKKGMGAIKTDIPSGVGNVDPALAAEIRKRKLKVDGL